MVGGVVYLPGELEPGGQTMVSVHTAPVLGLQHAPGGVDVHRLRSLHTHVPVVTRIAVTIHLDLGPGVSLHHHT